MFHRSTAALLRRLIHRGAMVAAMAALLAACAADAPAASELASAESSIAASGSASSEPPDIASPSAAASPSDAADLCLPAEIISAINEVADGSLEPGVALNEIADSLEALDLSGSDVPFAEQDRDDFVEKLRAADPDPTALGFAANVFQVDLLPDISEC